MPKSEAFIRIRAQVLEIVAVIPHARLTTYPSIGEHLDVMPRHVAYILAQLDDLQKMVIPWHRVVAGDGGLGSPKRGPDGRTQAVLLEAEGFVVAGNRVVAGFDAGFVPAAWLPHEVPKQQRPPPGRPRAAARR